jgi:uncharacterized protein YpmB
MELEGIIIIIIIIIIITVIIIMHYFMYSLAELNNQWPGTKYVDDGSNNSGLCELNSQWRVT